MSEIRVDTISEKTSANGVSIDGLTIKDGGISATTGAIVFNEASADLDFRVESNGNTHMLFVDGGNDKVGIGTSAPVVPLSVRAAQEQLTLSEGDARGATFDYRSSTGNLNITTNGGNARSAPQFTLDLNGKVGIGTASPAKPLHISSADNQPLRVESTDAYSGVELKDNGASTLPPLISGLSDGFKIYAGHGSSRPEVMSIDATGAVTMPLQPAFLATPAAQQSNLANGTTLLFGTEVTDRNADYNTSDGRFTAPVTGLYQVGYSLRLQEVPNDTNYVMIEITSSNRNYYNIIDTGVFDQEAAYYEFNGNFLIDMDANDNYLINYIQSGGTTSTDMSTASYSFGTLAC